MFARKFCRWFAIVLCIALSGCGIPRPADSPLIIAPENLPEPLCVVPPKEHALIGVWYVVSKQVGVAGEVQTLLTLSEDGKVRQQMRVKQGRNIRSELRETGCWDASAGKLALRINRSNGERIDYRDPIYTTTYIIERSDPKRIVFREDKPNSRPMTAQRVQNSFRLM